MRQRKYLLIPGNNSLSHVAKCLAIREALMALGQEARIAVSRKHAPFLHAMTGDHFVLPDIQEIDESGFPSVEWFRQPDHISDCVKAEVALLEAYQPDRVLGVFRFTLKASARIAGIPYDSLACGCMIPDSEEVLGFAPGEPGRENQHTILDGFFRYAGRRAEAAFVALGCHEGGGDIRRMLKGERTFLWDFPEFSALPERSDLIHVGPVSWDRWPYDDIDVDRLLDGGQPLALVAFGTCTVCLASAKRIIGQLLDLGYRILLAAGGKTEFLDLMTGDPRIVVLTYAPLQKLLPYASLLVTHGGQLTVFEALQNEVPVVVMPFQPEQAHNGVCLERMGCGVRLVPPQSFQGNSRVYAEALERMTDAELREKITGLVEHPQTAARLADARLILSRYKGVKKLAASLEDA